METSGHIDGGTVSQRHHRANARDRHQAPAHLIIPHDSQQAAMQDDDLFAQHPPDNEHGFDQHRQVGEVLNQLPDARLELYLPNHADLEAEVTQSTAQIVVDGDGLRLQRLAMGQQHPQFLTT